MKVILATIHRITRRGRTWKKGWESNQDASADPQMHLSRGAGPVGCVFRGAVDSLAGLECGEMVELEGTKSSWKPHHQKEKGPHAGGGGTKAEERGT